MINCNTVVTVLIAVLSHVQFLLHKQQLIRLFVLF